MVVFKRVRWKNLLSTGNSFTEIDLNKSSNTLIVGSNGAGKSTILDALCFGLFGKPFRKINKPALLNSINQQQCVVEIEFEIGSKKYKVVRGIKPNVFEIYNNGNLVNQDAKARDYQEHLEKFILKLNYKTFTQVVVLGSASFIPFMQLTPADRRAIIEDLLDIQIFSSMNVILKQKLSDIKELGNQLNYNIKLTAEKIQLQRQNIQEHKKSNREQIEKKKDEIQENQDHIEKLQSESELIQKHINALTKKITSKIELEKNRNEISRTISTMEMRITQLTKEIRFFTNHTSCPTCQQEIDDVFRTGQISKNNEYLSESNSDLNDLKGDDKKISQELKKIEDVIEKINDHSSELVKRTASINAIHKYIKKIENEIKELEETHSTMGSSNIKLKELKKELKQLLEEQEELSMDKYYYEYAGNMLKDSGIKTKIIKQYLPIMNKLINKYLTSLDFFVNFNIDENFQETIKSRHRDDFTYDSFSEGEKLRIDLALLFTWRQVAKMKNSTNTNLLILDEVFDSSLDAVGTEEFLKLLNDMDKDTNIFIISHKGDQLFEKFSNIIKFTKRNNFSQVIE